MNTHIENMWTTPVIVALMLCSIVSWASKHLTAQDTENDFVTFELVDWGTGVQAHSLNLGTVPLGTTKRARVLLQNRTGKPLRLVSAKVACSCTEAKVPKVTLENKETAKLEFSFSFPNHAKSLRESFQVDLYAEGATERTLLNFFANVSNVANFANNEIVRTYREKDATATFDIPVLLSDPKVLNKLRIEASPELSFLDKQLLSENGNVFVRCRFSDDAARNSDIFGRIQLFGPYVTDPSVVRCTLRRESRVSILPNKLTLAPSRDENRQFIASALIRIRSADSGQSNTTEDELRSVICDDPTGRKLNVDFNKVGAGLYRIRLSVDLNADKPLKEDRILSWNVSFGNASVSIQTPYTFAN
ncbi:MAG: DUF1573 domain-containing protein [Pirellulaceae bacterium]|nr:DUF1573 domain-containing protein [Pirellulaceae bacterium]